MGSHILLYLEVKWIVPLIQWMIKTKLDFIICPKGLSQFPHNVPLLTNVSAVPSKVPGAWPVGKPVVMFGGQHEIFSSRSCHKLSPGGCIEKECCQLRSKLMVFKIWWIMFGHKIYYFHVSWIVWVSPIPLKPEPLKYLSTKVVKTWPNYFTGNGRDTVGPPVHKYPNLCLIIPGGKRSGV